MDNKSDNLSLSYFLSLSSLTKQQCSLIKGHIVNMDNRFNEVFLLFNPTNPRFQPGNRIIDSFSNRFSFHLSSKSSDYSLKSCIQQLNALTIESSNSLTNTLMVTDASVKNNVASSIAYIHVHNKPMVKTLHYVVNATTSEAKFFAIRYSINQAILSHEIFKIIVVIDSIHVTKKIFNPSLHMLQKQAALIQAALILRDLREFFNHHPENIIEFWKCPSKSNWHLHKAVDTDTKSFNLAPFLLNKNSWDFSKKSESDNIINKWKITFQASDLKGRSFLDLVNSNNNILEPIYCKGGTWL